MKLGSSQDCLARSPAPTGCHSPLDEPRCLACHMDSTGGFHRKKRLEIAKPTAPSPDSGPLGRWALRYFLAGTTAVDHQ